MDQKTRHEGPKRLLSVHVTLKILFILAQDMKEQCAHVNERAKQT